QFTFRRFQHDYGSKTVLGKTGNFDGDEVLDLLLSQKQTAKFLTQKIYKFFVNEYIDDEKVNWLADRFYQSVYDIGKLMEDIFTSDWFYEEKNIGSKIKSPIELIAGIQRMLPMELENEEALTFLQRALGQMLFYPPNVAGWPGGKAWIDSSSLMLRMRLPQLINEVDELNVKTKDDDDQMMGKRPTADRDKPKGYAKRSIIKANIEWKEYIKHFDKVQKEQLIGSLASNLLQTKSNVSNELIKQYTDAGSRESFIKSATLQLMSTPEYQLC
ncbi:MAG TPA: DUF1800 family protein, partial [Chitinophagaceae bacterium]|nr:DUF1800 family protein [Chitinophagaceae bacterium]